MSVTGNPVDGAIGALVVALAEALRARGWRIATAESCTGGLIAGACTDLAGASVWFERGFVCYSNEAKTEMLGVDAALVRAHGAVSEPVVRAMAAGALVHSRAQLAAAVTGIAGPGGGSADKPVGTVWIGWARRAADGRSVVDASLHCFAGDRSAVRRASVQVALNGLLDRVHDA